MKCIPDKRLSLNPKFSGSFEVVGKDGALQTVYITKVLYNKPVVVVWWSDGTKTKSTVRGEDEYSKETGLIYSIIKKIAPDMNLSQLFSEWTPVQNTVLETTQYVTLKDVRNQHKK